MKLVCILLLLVPTVSSAVDDTVTVDSTAVVKDTVLYQPVEYLTTLAPITDSTNFEKALIQKPMVALVKSMVIPGLGQLGNRRYTKALIFAGLDAWFVGASLHYGKQTGDFRDKYDDAVETSLRQDYYQLFLDRKDERNKYRWMAGITAFIAMFDAYVDAHLSGFPDKRDDDRISLDVGPRIDGSMAASISIRF